MATLLPVVCSVIIYYYLELIPKELTVSYALAWWYAGAVGVIVMTPVTLALLSGNKASIKKLAITTVLPVLISACVAIYTFGYLSAKQADYLQMRLGASVQLYAKKLQDGFDQSLDASRIMRNRLFEGGIPTASEFRQLAAALLKENPQIQALEWEQKVPVAARVEFEKKIRATVNSDFKINFSNAPKADIELLQRPYLFPITYIEPYKGNEKALGLDPSSYPRLRTVLAIARDTGQPVYSSVRQLELRNTIELGLASYLPVYEGISPVSIEQRRQELKGYITTVYQLDKIIDSALAAYFDPSHIIRIFQIEKDGPQLELGHYGEVESNRFNHLSVFHTFAIGTEQWQLKVTPSSKFLSQNNSSSKWYVLSAGLFFTSALGFLLTSISTRQSQVEKLVRQRSRQLLSTQDQLRLAATSFNTHESIVILDRDVKIQRVNEAFVETMGYSEDEVTGKNPSILSSSEHSKGFYENLWNELLSNGKFEGELINRRRDGSTFPVRIRITAIKDNGNNIENIIVVYSDISEQKAAEEQIHQLAYYDSLTNLPNRQTIIDRLEHELYVARRYNYSGAVLFIDIDNFKNINDTLGHDHGDQLLIQVGERLSAQVRQVDTVARLGGDEFVILLQSELCHQDQAITNATIVCNKILAMHSKHYDIDGHRHFVTLSIGASIFPTNARTPKELLKQSDIALYKAKAMGKNNYCFFHEDMQRLAEYKLHLEQDLREALVRGQISLNYQPQLTENGSVFGVEVLARWTHPTKGPISPAEFIPVAEESGLILKLGDWVLTEACRQTKQWMDGGIDIQRVSVNVSERQFRQENFVQLVQHTLNSTGLPADRLMLELTESVVVEDIDAAQRQMNALKKLGIKMAMDDFGTGYSSLSYLSKLPFEELKIDQTFVRDLFQESGNTAIVSTIIAMAEHLNISVVAEGVEKIDQFSYLRNEGCAKFQGYYFSPPLDARGLEAYIASIANRSEIDIQSP